MHDAGCTRCTHDAHTQLTRHGGIGITHAGVTLSNRGERAEASRHRQRRRRAAAAAPYELHAHTRTQATPEPQLAPRNRESPLPAFRAAAAGCALARPHGNVNLATRPPPSPPTRRPSPRSRVEAYRQPCSWARRRWTSTRDVQRMVWISAMLRGCRSHPQSRSGPTGR